MTVTTAVRHGHKLRRVIYMSGLVQADVVTMPLSSLATSHESTILADALQKDGFDNFSVSTASLEDMFAQVIGRCLDESRTDPQTVRGVILCSESLLESAPDASTTTVIRRLRRICSELRIGHAQPFIHGMSACMNLTSALQIGTGLVASAEMENVIVAIAERRPQNRPRIVDGYVFGDMATAFLLTTRQTALKVHAAFSHNTDQGSLTNPGIDRLAQARALARGVRSLSVAALQRKMRLGGQDRLICDNLGTLAITVAASALELSRNQLETPTKRELGHAFSMDCLVSLRRLLVTRSIRRNARIGLLNLGPWSVGFIDLSYVPMEASVNDQ